MTSMATRAADSALDQRPLSQRDCIDWDVVIVGAGPAGTTAAISLARSAHRVLLLDKALFPREKVCGDGLIADAQRALDGLGLLEEVQRLGYGTGSSAMFSPAGIRVDIPGRFITLKRLELDALLVREAVRSGAVVRQCAVEHVIEQDDGSACVTAMGGRLTLRGRVLLLATGAEVALASQVGLVARSEARAIAARCYVRSTARLDSLVISFDRSIIPGYAWIFPLGDGEYNVGCGALATGPQTRVNLRHTLHAFIDRFPLARDLMRQASVVTPLRGARLRCGLSGTRTKSDGNLLVIGESAGSTFPFTGEGIGKAMETATMAADITDRALRSGDMRVLEEYPRRIDDDLRPRYRGYEIAQRWASVRWLNDLVAARAARSQSLRQALAGILTETVDPRAVCSVRALVRSVLS